MDFADNNTEAVKPHTKRLGREFAMQFLFSCEMQDELPGARMFDTFFESVCNEYKLRDNRLSRKGREYAIALYNEVVVHKEDIDKLISSHCENWDWDRVSAVERNIMRVAIAEMCYFPDVPEIVSIDEAVEIARDFSGEKGGNFINGVLNAIKNTIVKE